MASSQMPEVDLSENLQPNLYASTTIPFFFALVCVILRFWCRWTNRAGFWLDDWLILAAFVSAVGLTADLLWWIPRGLGRHIQTFGDNVFYYWAIGLFTAEITYTGVIVFVKFSILALYWRIFSKSASIKVPIAIMSSAVAMWGIAVFLLTVLQCIPTRGFWDKSIESSCNVDGQKFLFSISIPNILIDCILLVMPVPYVMRLHASKNQKTLIISMFFLGGFVCIASIMRLIAVVNQKNDPDITWDFINQAIWATVEADFAIISACLPTLRPLWSAIRGQKSSTNAWASSLYGSTTGNSQKRPQTWDRTILRSNIEEEDDTKPFSGAHANLNEIPNFSTALHPQQTGQAVAIPLSSIESANSTQDPGTIRINKTWGIEYSR